MSEPRLPARIEASALIRSVEAAGGFAAVVKKGDLDAGAMLILTIEGGGKARLWEKLPSLDGPRRFHVTREQDPENADEFSEYVARRVDRDPDCWVVELDIANPERFIAELGR
jgi:hypothetical protein